MVTPMTLFFDPIVALNNQGCYFLGQGQRDEAMGQFKAALTHLRSTLHDDVEKNKTCARPLPSLVPLHWNEFHETLLSAHHQPHWIDSSDCTTNNRLLAADDSQYVTFSMAIPLLPGCNFSSEAVDNEKVYTAVIIFNLALTLHLRALEHTSSSSSSSSFPCVSHAGLLKKAKSLYLHAYNLIVPIMNAYTWDGQVSDNVAFDLLVMGVLNNLALIHLELVEHADCNSAFEHLLQYVKVSSFRSRHGPDGCCDDDDNNDDNDDAPPVLDGHAARPSTTRDENDDDDEVRQRREPSRTDTNPDEDEPFRRMHRMMDQVVNDLILNATYMKWNFMVGVAAAA